MAGWAVGFSLEKQQGVKMDPSQKAAMGEMELPDSVWLQQPDMGKLREEGNC